MQRCLGILNSNLCDILIAMENHCESFANPQINRLENTDHPFHNWYRFVLSFPAHIVRDYLVSFGLQQGQSVLDPFCGTGTTAVESRLLGFKAYGIESNPMAHFASRVKASAGVLSSSVIRHWSVCVAESAKTEIARAVQINRFDDSSNDLLLKDCIGEIPLHKVLVLRSVIEKMLSDEILDYALLALAKTAVQTASNLHFAPEVGVRGRKEDAPVVESWFRNMQQMADDVDSIAGKSFIAPNIIHADARDIGSVIPHGSIDAVFTSPPYPNEKDYTRATRLESVLLRFIQTKSELQHIKRRLIRSNTRGVYSSDDDHLHVNNKRVHDIAEEIESRRISLGKNSGFEKLYGRLTKLYFGGMARHLESMKPLLKPGAFLGYVVGDQASYLQVHIATGGILAEIAEEIGYTHVRSDLFRTRISTRTKQQLREEVVVLRWEG